MDVVPGFIMLGIGGIAYFLPWIVASRRSHHNRNSIGIINIFLGWTGLGWIVALAMSVSEVHHAPKLEVSTQGNLFD